jgi:3-deoxy-7-phosphoheptulonate synthase
MIYNFEKHDPALSKFVDLLRGRNLDYELTDHDRAVIRILGVVPDDLGTELQRVYTDRRRLVLAGKTETSIHADFADTSRLTIIAGPCSIESEGQVASTASYLKAGGIRYLRGGAYKPRTSPDSFQGLGEIGLRLMAEIAHSEGMMVVSEVMDKSQIDVVCKHTDVLQVGSRNMFNYTLLTAVGSVAKPTIVKRGMAATIDEWLKAAEYVSRGGNDSVILCERGIRTFEPRTRNTLDVAAIHIAKKLSGLPVIADPSHAAGDSDLVIPLAVAAAAAGADGLMIEVHPEPSKALSDRRQALSFEQFDELLRGLKRIQPR